MTWLLTMSLSNGIQKIYRSAIYPITSLPILSRPSHFAPDLGKTQRCHPSNECNPLK